MTGAPRAAQPTGQGDVERWLRCANAWVDDTMHDDVLLGITGDRIAVVETDPATADTGAAPVEQVHGVVLPGLVDAHSHVFHRALRGRTHGDGGTFWTWRTRMYELAASLDPATLRALAVAVLAEQAEAGVTTLGEFHYVHHRPDGSPYDQPNAMGLAILDAAAEVGLRVTLLDALYLTGGVGRTAADPGLDAVQRRFSDGTVAAWADRVEELARHAARSPRVHVGAALHSVRAVPPDALATAVAAVPAVLTAVVDDGRAIVLHAHVAEQPREVEEARAVHGRTPLGLLADAGALAHRFTAVHGVWLDERDVAALAAANALVCACPTTERDLADGVVAGDELHAAGVDLALGSDQHVATDLLAEARLLERHRRLVTGRRGGLPTAVLLDAATRGGARSLGWDEAGRIAPGALADLCVVDLSSSRLADLGVAADRGGDLAAGVLASATAADVAGTIVGGRWIVRDGRHTRIDVPEALRTAVRDAWRRTTGEGGP